MFRTILCGCGALALMASCGSKNKGSESMTKVTEQAQDVVDSSSLDASAEESCGEETCPDGSCDEGYPDDDWGN